MKISSLILSNDIDTGIRILVLSGIAWLPLVVLTLIDGTLISSEISMPFIKDVVPYVRGLVAIPLLVMADNVIEPMMTRVVKYLRISGVVPDGEQTGFNASIDRIAYLINAKWAQVLLVLLAVLVSWLLQVDYVEMWKELGVTSWALNAEGTDVDLTFAGLWYLLVASPMVSFLLYRWVWRFIVWSAFLYRVSRMKLELYASHTDLAGGLGMIGAGQALFGIVFLIMASLVSSDIASNILYEGDTLIDARLVVMVFIVGSIIVIALPLLFFTRKLYALKRRSMAEYGILQLQISRDFHKHWIEDRSTGMVDSIHPSSMADYSAVYETVSSMSIIPLNPKTVLVLGGGITAAIAANLAWLAGAGRVYALRNGEAQDRDNPEPDSVVQFGRLDEILAKIPERSLDLIIDVAGHATQLLATLPLLRDKGRAFALEVRSNPPLDLNLYPDLHRRSIVLKGLPFPIPQEYRCLSPAQNTSYLLQLISRGINLTGNEEFLTTSIQAGAEKNIDLDERQSLRLIWEQN